MVSSVTAIDLLKRFVVIRVLGDGAHGVQDGCGDLAERAQHIRLRVAEGIEVVGLDRGRIDGGVQRQTARIVEALNRGGQGLIGSTKGFLFSDFHHSLLSGKAHEVVFCKRRTPVARGFVMCKWLPGASCQDLLSLS